MLLPAALLVLVLGHDAVAAGGLRPLVRFEDRIDRFIDFDEPPGAGEIADALAQGGVAHRSLT